MSDSGIDGTPAGRCVRHALPQPCETCGEERWRIIIAPSLPTWRDSDTAETAAT